MQWLRNLPISRKFIYAFGIVCGLCIVLGAFTFFTFRSIAQKSADVSENSLPSLIALANISTATHNARREDLDLLLCQTAQCSSDHNAKRQKALADYHETLKTYETMVSYPGERELYQKFTTSWAQYEDASNRANAFLAASKIGDALDLMTSDAVVSTYHTAFVAIDDDVHLNAKYGTEESTAATESSTPRHLDQHRRHAADRSALRADRRRTDARDCAAAGQTARAALERMAAKDLTASIDELPETTRSADWARHSIPAWPRCAVCWSPWRKARRRSRRPPPR